MYIQIPNCKKYHAVDETKLYRIMLYVRTLASFFYLPVPFMLFRQRFHHAIGVTSDDIVHPFRY